MNNYDVVVAGGGVNGLVTAAYLARAGQRVLVAERRSTLGGVADVLPTAGRLRPSVIDDLRLRDHGLELIRPAVRMLALADDGNPIPFFSDAGRTADALRARSAADADAYRDYDARVRALAGFLGTLNAASPPRLDRVSSGDLGLGVRLGKAFRGLGAQTGRELTRALPMAVADFVREWFTDDAVCGALAARGTLLTAMGPWSAGTTLVLLNDLAEGDAGAPGETAIVRGGSDALAAALRSAAEAAGADVRTDAEVTEVLVAGTLVRGVTLASGEEVETPAVAAAVDPKTVLREWLDPVVVGPQLLWRAGNIRTRGHAAAVELELRELPAFTGVDDTALLEGRIVAARGIDDVERAFDASKYGELSERPQIEMVIPSLADPSQAPAGGGHLLRAVVQWVPPGEDLEDAVADRLVEELERHAPGIGELVTARRTLTPAGIERELGLSGGHVLHVEPGLDQWWGWRPVLGLARYRLPVRGLYLCGAGAHPGGGITGGPGQNAAREILRDLG